jgi:hypothetical protein
LFVEQDFTGSWSNGGQTLNHMETEYRSQCVEVGQGYPSPPFETCGGECYGRAWCGGAPVHPAGKHQQSIQYELDDRGWPKEIGGRGQYQAVCGLDAV